MRQSVSSNLKVEGTNSRNVSEDTRNNLSTGNNKIGQVVYNAPVTGLSASNSNQQLHFYKSGFGMVNSQMSS